MNHAINKNDTWELTSLPKGHQAISVMWVYKTRTNAHGKIQKFKVKTCVERI